MDKLKQVLSSKKKDGEESTPGQGDSPISPTRHTTGGITGEGSHLAGANALEQKTGSLPPGESHPIYDEFTGHGHKTTASGQPTKTVDQAPHFSNTTNLDRSPKDSTLSPIAAESTRPTPGDGVSNASIKSGVQGHPQAASTSNQTENLGQRQGLGATTLPDRTAPGETKDSSHTGRNTAAGAGTAGAAALAAHDLNRRHDGNGAQEPHVTTTSNREFPLAGGVTSRQPDSNTATNPNTTSGTGVHDGRQALAGAAAAAGSHPTSGTVGNTAETTRGTGAAGNTNPTATESRHGPNRDALAGATAAFASHEHAGHGHNFSGDPCQHDESASRSGAGFTQGPHATDTANRYDPHMHVPGEFPDPTPAEEREEPSLSEHQNTHDTKVAGAGLPLESQRDHPTSTDPAATHPTVGNTDQKTSEHHYGRDAALASAGAGAVGAGTYYASQRNEKQDTGPASATIGPHDSNVANVLDPRVQPDPQIQKHHQAGPTAEDPASKTVGPHKSNIANIVDPRVQPEPEKMKGHTTTGPHQSDTLNRLDPKADSKAQPQEQQQQHHHGRDAAIAGGAGAAGVGAYEAGKHHSREPQDTGAVAGQSASKPSTAFGEQRYDPTASSAPANTHGASGHHYGKDAAVVGGTGAAGYGASEVAQKYADHRSTGPAAAMSDQRYDPVAPKAHDSTQPQSQHHYGRDAALAGGVGAVGAGTYAATRPEKEEPHSINKPAEYQQPQHEHHYGRDAAIAGGAGAAGAGAYAATRPEKDEVRHVPRQTEPQQPQQPQQPQHEHHYGRDAAIAGGAGAAGAGVYAATRPEKEQSHPVTKSTETQQPTGSHQRYDSAANPQAEEHHYKRDAAVAGAGAGAVGAGAYEYSKHDAEKERLAQQKAQDKELDKQLKEQKKEAEAQQKKDQKALEKEHKKEEKEHEKEEKKHQREVAAAAAAQEKKHQKEAEKEEKKHQKEAEKEEKKHEKEVAAAAAAEEKKHQKEAEKEEKKHQKEAEKEEAKHQKELEKREKEEEKEEGKEKKHHLLGFLHRDKKDKEPEEEKQSHEKEPIAAGAGAATADEHENGKDRHRLHKDPPPGHPAREALQSGFYEHMGTDGQIGRRDMVSGDHETDAGKFGAHKINE